MTGVQTCALPICFPVTIPFLVSLRDSNMLIAGRQYRITDYTCTTVQTDSRSEGNDFDIIVVADSNSLTLSSGE